VDLYGNMPDYERLRALCDRHGLNLIEDAAEAVGATYRRRLAGGFGDASTFSFHGSKTLTTGEGGMLLTDDEQLYRRAGFLRDHGRNPGDTTFRSTEVAYKYKMSSMQAALGLAQLERVDELVACKRATFAWYREAFAETRLGREGLATLNVDLEGIEPSYWMVTVILDPSLGWTKTELIAGLRERGVDSRPFFDPLSSLSAFRDSASASGAAERNPTAYALAPYGVNLPSALSLTEDDVHTVCARLDDCLGVS
jgi:perosamine synthetase